MNLKGKRTSDLIDELDKEYKKGETSNKDIIKELQVELMQRPVINEIFENKAVIERILISLREHKHSKDGKSMIPL